MTGVRGCLRVLVLGSLTVFLGCRGVDRFQPRPVPRPDDVHRAAWWQLPDRVRLLEREVQPRPARAHRNLFDFGTAPVEHIREPPRPAPAPAPAPEPAVSAPEPSPSPQAAPVPRAGPAPVWRLIGIVRAQDGEPRFAVLFDGNRWRVVYPDVVLGPGLRVKAIEEDAVVLESRQGDRVQDLRITFERG